MLWSLIGGDEAGFRRTEATTHPSCCGEAGAGLGFRARMRALLMPLASTRCHQFWGSW